MLYVWAVLPALSLFFCAMKVVDSVYLDEYVNACLGVLIVLVPQRS